MNGEPLISVCIPAYNQEDYIAETIRSVLDQDHPSFEIVISDDRSTDCTPEVIREFRDDRIRFFQNEANLGIEGNWNKALTLARGKYIKLLCGDDVLHPGCLSSQAALLEAPGNEGIVMVTALKDVIGPTGRVILSGRNLRIPGRMKGQEAIRRCVRAGTNILGEPASGLFRREVLKRSGLCNGEYPYLIDLDLWSRILLYGDVFVLDRVLYSFRISPGALSSGIGFRQAGEVIRFMRALHDPKRYPVTVPDLILSGCKAVMNVLARNMLYFVFLKIKGHGTIANHPRI